MTGVKLASEIPASKDNLRRFITVFAYVYDDRGIYRKLSKILKPTKMENEVFFELRIYELLNEYFENKWDVTDNDLANDILIEDIKGLENLGTKIIEFIEDVSTLKPEWNCDNPI